VIPSVPVTLTQVSGLPGTSALRATGRATAAAVKRTMMSGPNGRYSFTHLSRASTS
jgi:hypothetical protein